MIWYVLCNSLVIRRFLLSETLGVQLAADVCDVVLELLPAQRRQHCVTRLLLGEDFLVLFFQMMSIVVRVCP